MKKKRSSPLEGAIAAVLVLAVALVAGIRAFDGDGALPTPPAPATAAAHPACLHGRVTTVDGEVLEGRLRWGGDEEAFWTDLFDGAKSGNPWVVHAPPEQLTERRPIEVFGLALGSREHRVDVDRPFMARFGDLARLEVRGRDVRVALKSGTVFVLDRHEAGDIDDGVRVWDERRGAVDVASRRIRSVEFLAGDRRGPTPHRLHGTVCTRQGDFTGFVRWGREARLASDTLSGRTADGVGALRFDTVRSIARRSSESCSVTLVDGRELVVSDDGDVGPVRRVHVDDPRHGRVRVSWDAFERVDFSPATPDDGGPAHADFPAGRPLTGQVTTRDGRRLAGRLVFDLDESETTETLDAPAGGVHHSVPFGLIASIEPRARDGAAAADARVTLQDGLELRLERDGDLGDGNAGLLVFADEDASPTYVAWADVARIDLIDP